MASKYWIKLYHEILDDPKMGRMPDRLWRRTIELFLLAGELDDDGALPEIKDMAWRLRIDDNNLTDDLTYLTNYGIVHQVDNRFVVSKFAERQAPISDAERMKRMRDRKQKEQYYGDEPVTEGVTNRNVDTDIDTESDTYTELKKGLTGDFFDDCVYIYKAIHGEFMPDHKFVDMIKEFEANGVTTEDYYDAIKEQDADPDYTGEKPTSYKKWAINNAQRRLNPRKPTRTPRTPDDLAAHNARVLEQLAEEY